MFKHTSNHNYDTIEETTQVSTPAHAQDKTSTPNPMETSKNKEDINTEAAEFIKRTHHNLELQKLLSMKANAR
jgi:Cotton fibre expressed protein